MEAITLASLSGVRLELTPATGPYGDGHDAPTWMARLAGQGLDAVLLCPEAGWQPMFLADYLAGLDKDFEGWEGERSWASGEGELRLNARHNKVNTILISVALEDGAPPRWRCEAELELDPGALRQIAADAQRLAQVSSRH